jgi:hypothetical protein
MGIFKGVKLEGNSEFVLREPGTYEFNLVEVQAGLLNTQFSDEPKPVLRFLFQDEDGKLSAFVNIPSVSRLPSGEYGLAWNEKSKFWAVVGALWGRVIGPEDASLLDMDIPGVKSTEDLARLPLFFVEGQEPVRGVRILMGNEEVSAPGRSVLLTLSKKQGRDREVNVITGYAPIPKKKAAKAAAATPW